MSSIYDLELEISKLKKWQEAAMDVITQIKKNFDMTIEVWSDKDLCRNWQISARTAATLRASGELDYFRIGNKVYYSREMRENYIKKTTYVNSNEKL